MSDYYLLRGYHDADIKIIGDDERLIIDNAAESDRLSTRCKT